MQLHTIVALVLACAPAIATADKRIEDIPKADAKAALGSWTPVQQWRAGAGMSTSKPVEFALMADELGTKLAELGRARWIENCLRHPANFEDGVLAWAACRHDVTALDLKKLERELVAEGIAGTELTDTLGWVKDIVKTAKATGEPIEALAKTEPGVQQILDRADAGRSEWAAYVSKNKAAVDRYLAIKDAVRTARGDDKAFTGCYEATRPAFARIVKAALPNIPYDFGDDAIDGYTSGYLSFMPATIDTYISSVAYAGCLWSLQESAGHFYRVAASVAKGRAMAGPRTVAIAKLLDETFKPKFADRSLSWRRPRDWAEGPSVSAAGTYDETAATGSGEIRSLKAEGDMTKIVFKGANVEHCLQYGKDVNRTCLVKGMLWDENNPGLSPTKFMAGAKPGMSIALKFGFPEVIWNAKTKKLISILTIPVN